MAPRNLTDLPPELLDHITTYLPTAQSVARLGKSCRDLHTYVEKDAWHTFSRTRFPSIYSAGAGTQASHRHDARTLTTLSKAWDRRAFVASYLEPHGDIRAFPGDRRLERWKRPRGQTIGFLPQLDCYEEISNPSGTRKEILAFSAGAEICLRERSINTATGDDARWMTYRPLSAVEGRDDVTCMHLVRPQEGDDPQQGRTLVTGTANGDLQLLQLPPDDGSPAVKTYFPTQGRDVRSTSVLQKPFNSSLLAANLGESHLCVYSVDQNAEKIPAFTEIDVRPQMSNGRRNQRIWSTNFLSSTNLAIGLGPSEEPLHIYALSPSGLTKEPIRKFGLRDGMDNKRTSSTYPVVPLPPATTASGSGDGQVFLSGAYDGIIRLHDLRSSRDFESIYTDPTEDGSIYSLLPRGRESLVAGTSRHSLLKVFDLRLGSKAYSYLGDQPPDDQQTGKIERTKDYSLFITPQAATYPGRGGGNNWARRSAESSVYSLTSPSPNSPYIYAGVENAIVAMAFTSLLDAHPDPTYFRPLRGENDASKGTIGGMRVKDIFDLAMYDQTADMTLHKQRSVWETVRSSAGLRRGEGTLDGLDERWKIGS